MVPPQSINEMTTIRELKRREFDQLSADEVAHRVIDILHDADTGKNRDGVMTAAQIGHKGWMLGKHTGAKQLRRLGRIITYLADNDPCVEVVREHRGSWPAQYRYVSFQMRKARADLRQQIALRRDAAQKVVKWLNQREEIESGANYNPMGQVIVDGEEMQKLLCRLVAEARGEEPISG